MRAGNKPAQAVFELASSCAERRQRGKHYLKRGNAPDWSTSHVCVQSKYSGLNTAACDRLFCYQPKPGI